MRVSEAELARLGKPKDTKAKAEPRRGRMNGWEKSFRDEYLEPWRLAGEIDNYRFEAVTLTLYDGSTDVRKSRVTLDFLAWKGKQMFLYEVKGQRRRSSIEKLKNAAQQYPMIGFFLCTGGPGRWDMLRL